MRFQDILMAAATQGRGGYAFSFMGGALPGGATLTRASSGWYFDSSGVLQSAATDVARFIHNPSTLALEGLLVEPPRTNSIRNPRFEGGVAGSPGTLPTNFSAFNQGTLTRTLSFGSENGIPYMDVRLSGTTSTLSTQLLFEFVNQIAAVSGETWALSVYVSRPAGSFSNISAARLQLNEHNAASAYLGGSSVSILSASSSALRTQRFTHQRTLSNATTAYVAAALDLVFPSGVAIDITLRFGLPQVEKGAGASSIILPPVSSPAATTRAADVLSLALPDGTYSVDIARLSGVTNLTGVAVSGGSYTVPTDVSPLQSVIARRTA